METSDANNLPTRSSTTREQRVLHPHTPDHKEKETRNLQEADAAANASAGTGKDTNRKTEVAQRKQEEERRFTDKRSARL